MDCHRSQALAADSLLAFIIYGDFYWNAQQQAERGKEKPSSWPLCVNETVLFLCAQNSRAERRFDNQGRLPVSHRAEPHKATVWLMSLCLHGEPLSPSVFPVTLPRNADVGRVKAVKRLMTANKQRQPQQNGFCGVSLDVN